MYEIYKHHRKSQIVTDNNAPQRTITARNASFTAVDTDAWHVAKLAIEISNSHHGYIVFETYSEPDNELKLVMTTPVNKNIHRSDHAIE